MYYRCVLVLQLVMVAECNVLNHYLRTRLTYLPWIIAHFYIPVIKIAMFNFDQRINIHVYTKEITAAGALSMSAVAACVCVCVCVCVCFAGG